ncbi:hypothetical protein GCM10017771_35920 [Streptomyces capitiformicae]|uniref:Uncharacterized protein n=1 Tax=Streptomyces capitiformicae TaxID=2014920 RepID=A0A919GQC1_9ACTN|nr:hypothetical protein GCM10017771_35920 [Streptomyces capitiformicae]
MTAAGSSTSGESSFQVLPDESPKKADVNTSASSVGAGPDRAADHMGPARVQACTGRGSPGRPACCGRADTTRAPLLVRRQVVDIFEPARELERPSTLAFVPGAEGLIEAELRPQGQAQTDKETRT